MDDTEMIERHHRACDGFTAVVEKVDASRWGAQSPCTEWDARGVVEHVIGFHEMLWLRPLGIKTERPKDDPVARWRATSASQHDALERPGVLDQECDGPMGTTTPRSMIGPLTSDVLIHSWDLARATGLEPVLDEQLCAEALALAEKNAELFKGSEMFGDPVPVPSDAPVCDRLLGFFGRDPAWTAP
jgi:uncharacterized protein (TIGR03086 family)